MTRHAEATRRVGDVFSEWAEAGRGEGMERGHRPTAGRALLEMRIRPGDRFLDLGTGNGWACRDAAARGAFAVGVDASVRMLERARAAGGASYLRAAFEFLPFKDASVPAVFSMEALYYAPDLDAALREIRRVAAPGGEVVAVLDYYLENRASHDWPDLTGLPMRLLPEAGWREAFAQSGFSDVETDRLRTPPGIGDAWLQAEGSLRVRARP